MHLDKLEAAGLVHGHLELSETGKALRVYELVDFAVTVTPDVVTAALAHPVDRAAAGTPTDPSSADPSSADPPSADPPAAEPTPAEGDPA